MKQEINNSVAVGYCPRYLLHHVKDIQSQSEKLCVKVEKDVSAEVPLSFRLLCSLTADWKEKDLPFSNPQYQGLRTNKDPFFSSPSMAFGR